MIPRVRLSWQSIRHSSSIASLEEKLRKDLTSRKLPTLYDYLSPQPAYLLSRSIKDFLPPGSIWTSYMGNHSRLPPNAFPIPPGFHFAYFATPATESQLLDDGTDVLHYPGPPFTRRLWAGGSIKFSNSETSDFGEMPNIELAACAERIKNVRVSGKHGEEKVFVDIERTIGVIRTRFSGFLDLNGDIRDDDIRDILWNPDCKLDNRVAELEKLLTEDRQLVFMRPDANEQQPETDGGLKSNKTRRPLRPPHQTSDFSHTLTPTPSLLFRYSALMFNAHAIHLDPERTRTHEGQPKLLVHGPLLVTIMLSCLTSHAKLPEFRYRDFIESFSYRIYSPVYANEPMTIRIKKKKSRSIGSATEPEGSEDVLNLRGAPDAWDIWIEGPDHGLRAKGTANTILPNDI